MKKKSKKNGNEIKLSLKKTDQISITTGAKIDIAV